VSHGFNWRTSRISSKVQKGGGGSAAGKITEVIVGEAVILTEKLSKYYGKQRGVVDLDLEVQRGEVFGYLGPNGAGKTTTIRVLLDLIRPTRGRAEVLGMDVHGEGVAIRSRVGYLPGELALYDKMTGAELLHYLGNLRGGVDWGAVESLARRLDCDLSQRIKSLSKGNKQKIGLIQALMHRPELLILDEPTAGLDPLVQHELHSLIRELNRDGSTFFISSHNLPEVERICHRVGIIREGSLVAVDDIENLKRKALRKLEIHFGSAVPREEFQNIPGIRDLQVENNTLRCSVVGSEDALFKAAARFEILNVVSPEVSLEEIFIDYYQGDAHAG
jgi:ABC-2 type transport system ATP-binding protein